MASEEIPYQRAPAVVVQNRPQHGKTGGDETLDIVEKQLSVRFHPRWIDIRGCRMTLGVADICGKRELDSLEGAT